MRTIVSIFAFICCFATSSNAQVYLNDTSLYNSLWCSYKSVYEVDTGYFVMGNIVRAGNGNTTSLILGFHNNNGSKELILDNYQPLHDQRVFGSIHKLFRNNRGNFVYLYANCETSVGCYPRLKEISTDGVIIRDRTLQPLLDSANLSILDFNNIIQKKDSNYFLVINVVDTARLNAPVADGNGLFFIQLDSSFNLLDSARFFSTGSFINRGYGGAHIIESDKTILMIPEVLQSATDSLEEGKVLFMKLDSQGSILDTIYYTDGQKIGAYGLTKTADSGYLFTYLKGEFSTTINGWEYYRYLCKVDSNFSLVWKKLTDENVGYGSFFLDKEIKPTLDGNYVTAGGTYEDTSIYNQRFARILKFNENGDFLWKRRHFKVADSSVLFPIEIEINDIITTQDSGYCMVGRVNDIVAASVGNIRYYAYIVKTNCLGFLGNAVASASYSSENLDATFFNTSMQAGSYYWDFGDGTSLTTDEYADTVLHTFPSPSPSPSSASGGGAEDYDVMLIAYGCYDSLGVRDADTLLFTVTITEDGSSVVVTNNGYFVLFPNPSSSGGELSIYLNALDPNNGEVSLSFYSMDGKLVKKALLSTDEGTYVLDNNLARGMYEVALVQGGKVLQSEKLIIQ